MWSIITSTRTFLFICFLTNISWQHFGAGDSFKAQLGPLTVETYTLYAYTGFVLDCELGLLASGPSQLLSVIGSFER